jgi:hypothetical protein
VSQIVYEASCYCSSKSFLLNSLLLIASAHVSAGSVNYSWISWRLICWKQKWGFLHITLCTLVARNLRASLTVTNTHVVVSQPRYVEGGEAIAHKVSCSPLAHSIFPSPLTLINPCSQIFCVKYAAWCLHTYRSRTYLCVPTNQQWLSEPDVCARTLWLLIWKRAIRSKLYFL